MKIFKNIKPEFTDERGEITTILDDGKTAIRGVLIITSKKGSVRGNHYQKKDSHYCYVLVGKMKYFEKPINADNSKMKTAVLKKGDMVYTPPMVVHAFRFLENTTWVCLATKSRKNGAYEEDTVRVKLI
ncbi:MAG: hypothetical protein A3A16_02810 [Candidatus Harrisonbacteria bacterium RIFCSPLOWO2_01_FULL_44_18]|uniref:Cupin type-1 domain-containing protein n=1 Tax=Candidatus Harrisonbacteria bacterium RIFCSPLOWO2_01_FULL_44_18 TaxID=1798407 RepID=A0A1G1ZLC7_9BACT|nr:MAG: hypothetical protein A3A16_02810 [Candidatus Harrisonbacteria bacterium RIFCSPLOWO2_01_FULL_44_18]